MVYKRIRTVNNLIKFKNKFKPCAKDRAVDQNRDGKEECTRNDNK